MFNKMTEKAFGELVESNTYPCPEYMLTCLQNIKNKQNVIIYKGICDNVYSQIEILFGELPKWDKYVAAEWLKRQFYAFNMHNVFPVEYQLIGVNDGFRLGTKYHSQNDKFNPDSECGKIRLKLLDRLIEAAKEQTNV